jgi:K+-transporting ATPase ATPase C chain
MNDFLSQLKPALLGKIVFTILCGLAYPMIVYGIAQVAFHHQAEGSLVERGGQVMGSSLIGQSFTDPGYFWTRPSATTVPYDATSSSADNLGPTSPDLHKAVADRVTALRDANRAAGVPDDKTPVPIDLVTTSASGLDPDISPAAAYYQVRRVAAARNVPEGEVRALVDAHIEGRALGILGDPHVNVLELNLDLDALATRKR